MRESGRSGVPAHAAVSIIEAIIEGPSRDLFITTKPKRPTDMHWSQDLAPLRLEDAVLVRAQSASSPLAFIDRLDPRSLSRLLMQAAQPHELVRLGVAVTRHVVERTESLSGNEAAEMDLAVRWLALYEARNLYEAFEAQAACEHLPALPELSPRHQIIRMLCACVTGRRATFPPLISHAIELVETPDRVAAVLRNGPFDSRSLKPGELERARPPVQVCHDRVVHELTAQSVNAVGLVEAYTLRQQLMRHVTFDVPASDPEPWRGTPQDVDVHALSVIAHRLIGNGVSKEYFRAVLDMLRP